MSWITGRGMVALLDLHYNTIVPCGHVGLHEMADAPNSINFWEQVAARYKSNPLVAFDLYNEPNNIPDSVWLNGGQASEGRTVFNAAGMQQMYDAIRGQGANNLVFASANNWDRTFPPELLSGSNIVYPVHAYTCPHAPPPNCESPSDPYEPGSRRRCRRWPRCRKMRRPSSRMKTGPVQPSHLAPPACRKAQARCKTGG